MEITIPLISAVVCTRNRGASAVKALKSLLENDHSNFEVIIVDQSTNSRTREAIQDLSNNDRLIYIHSDTIGAGISRNIGLQEAHGKIVAYTDDDCEVPPNWLTLIEKGFKEHEKVAVLYCNVIAGPHEKDKGYIPTYNIKTTKVLRTMFDCFQNLFGLGAGMAINKEFAFKIGGFDPFLGPGSYFCSGEDHDIAVRALLNGWRVLLSADIAVTHHGFRTWKEGKEHTKRDCIGGGATYIKPVKCGYWSSLFLFLSIPVLRGVLEPFLLLLKFQRPTGFWRFIFLLKGASMGLLTPVDKCHILYKRV